jgi:type IV secretory pathway VirB10-like protein
MISIIVIVVFVVLLLVIMLWASWGTSKPVADATSVQDQRDHVLNRTKPRSYVKRGVVKHCPPTPPPSEPSPTPPSPTPPSEPSPTPSPPPSNGNGNGSKKIHYKWRSGYSVIKEDK